MKFSLIVCTYNPKEEWLLRALKSAEGLFDEYLIVDDGSDKVNVVEILGKMGVGNYRYFKHDINKGLWQARNTGVESATGDIIALLDDDDYFDRYGVEGLKEWIVGSAADIWHFHLQQFNGSNSIYGGGADCCGLLDNSVIPGVSWYKRSVWHAVGGYQYPLAEDWDFYLRAYKKGLVFDYYPHVIYNYNRRQDSRSAAWGGAMFDKIKKEVIDRNK